MVRGRVVVRWGNLWPKTALFYPFSARWPLAPTPAAAIIGSSRSTPTMKTRIALGLLLTVTLALRGATGVGDTYQQVIAQKGQPGGKMEAGDTMILRYP